MLVKKKEEIFQVTAEIMHLYEKGDEITAIQNKMNQILSLLSTIESFATPDRDLSNFTRLVAQISLDLEIGFDSTLLIPFFCTTVNSIKFDFTKKRLKISIPINIKEAILSKIQLG